MEDTEHEQRRKTRNKWIRRFAIGSTAFALLTAGYFAIRPDETDQKVKNWVKSLETQVTQGTLEWNVQNYQAGALLLNAHLYSMLDLRAISIEEREILFQQREEAYRNGFDNFFSYVDTLYEKPETNLEKWTALFRWQQINELQTYNYDQFEVGAVVDDNVFNCNSGTALFAARVLDLDARGWLDADPLLLLHFGDKKTGHILAAYKDPETKKVIQYFEATNPLNAQLPFYAQGEPLTFEEYIIGYLYGMGENNPHVRDMWRPVIQDMYKAQGGSYTDLLVEKSIDAQINAIKERRANIRQKNKMSFGDTKTLHDPFLFQPMGMDVEPSNPDTIDFLRYAEVSFVSHRWDEARYLADVAVQREKISDAEYALFVKNIESQRDIYPQMIDAVRDVDALGSSESTAFFYDNIGTLCVDPTDPIHVKDPQQHEETLQTIITSSYMVAAGIDRGLLLRAQELQIEYPDLIGSALVDVEEFIKLDQSRRVASVNYADDLADAYEILADIYDTLGMKEKAADACEKEAELRLHGEGAWGQYEIVDALQRCAVLAKREKDRNAAKEWLDMASARTHRPNEHAENAYLYYDLGRMEDARRELKLSKDKQ